MPPDFILPITKSPPAQRLPKSDIISLSSAPNRIAVNSQTHAVFATLAPSDLAIIDGTTKTVVETVNFDGTENFGSGPTEAVVNPLSGLIYVTGGSDVVIITPATYGTKAVSVVP